MSSAGRHHIIVLTANVTTTTSRIIQRARLAGDEARSDDNLLTVRARMREFYRHKNATLAVFKNFLRVGLVDGERTKRRVSTEISALVDGVR
mmetsp:Transcript_58462/g.96484  ORF Transcript_58462/g.96484 Transcript_58462/m.96484 type:complete len:92 (-) Transcript_58462:138-413(-)